MNSANLLRVADAIEKHEIAELGYNQELYAGFESELPDKTGHRCATTACLAGWAYALATGDTKLIGGAARIREEAERFLDVRYEDAHKLFSAAPLNAFGTEAAQAVRTLRYAAEHGVIDWDAAQKDAA